MEERGDAVLVPVDVIGRALRNGTFSDIGVGKLVLATDFGGSTLLESVDGTRFVTGGVLADGFVTARGDLDRAAVKAWNESRELGGDRFSPSEEGRCARLDDHLSWTAATALISASARERAEALRREADALDATVDALAALPATATWQSKEPHVNPSVKYPFGTRVASFDTAGDYRTKTKLDRKPWFWTDAMIEEELSLRGGIVVSHGRGETFRYNDLLIERGDGERCWGTGAPIETMMRQVDPNGRGWASVEDLRALASWARDLRRAELVKERDGLDRQIAAIPAT